MHQNHASSTNVSRLERHLLRGLCLAFAPRCGFDLARISFPFQKWYPMSLAAVLRYWKNSMPSTSHPLIHVFVIKHGSYKTINFYAASGHNIRRLGTNLQRPVLPFPPLAHSADYTSLSSWHCNITYKTNFNILLTVHLNILKYIGL